MGFACANQGLQMGGSEWKEYLFLVGLLDGQAATNEGVHIQILEQCLNRHVSDYWSLNGGWRWEEIGDQLPANMLYD